MNAKIAGGLTAAVTGTVSIAWLLVQLGAISTQLSALRDDNARLQATVQDIGNELRQMEASGFWVADSVGSAHVGSAALDSIRAREGTVVGP